MPLLLVTRRGRKKFLPTQMSVVDVVKLYPCLSTYFAGASVTDTVSIIPQAHGVVNGTVNDSVTVMDALSAVMKPTVIESLTAKTTIYRLVLNNGGEVQDALTTNNFKAVAVSPELLNLQLVIQKSVPAISNPKSFTFQFAGLGVMFLISDNLNLTDSVRLRNSAIAITGGKYLTTDIPIHNSKAVISSASNALCEVVAKASGYGLALGSVYESIPTSNLKAAVANPATLILKTVLPEASNTITTLGSVVDSVSMSNYRATATSSVAFASPNPLTGYRPIQSISKSFSAFSLTEVPALCIISGAVSLTDSVVATSLGSVSPSVSPKAYSVGVVQAFESDSNSAVTNDAATALVVQANYNRIGVQARASAPNTFTLINASTSGSSSSYAIGAIQLNGGLVNSAASSAHS